MKIIVGKILSVCGEQCCNCVHVIFLQSIVQCGEQSQPHYTYFVKIIPSDKKADAETFDRMAQLMFMICFNRLIY